MKRKYLFQIIFIIIFSACSSDENSEPTLPTLKKTEQREYSNGQLQSTIITHFNNNKIISFDFYNVNNQLIGREVWSYSNNVLSNIKTFSASNVLVRELNAIYNNGKLVQTINTEGSYTTTTTFTYNSNNTISSLRNSNGQLTNKTFSLNASGIIDKEYENGILNVSIQFNNFNPTSKISYGSTKVYTYHETGVFPYNFQEIFGTIPSNAQLFQNNLDNSSDILINKLILNVSTTGFIKQIDYTFNENNQPLTSKTYYNNILASETTYFYE